LRIVRVAEVLETHRFKLGAIKTRVELDLELLEGNDHAK
jgi:hypothetical protein